MEGDDMAKREYKDYRVDQNPNDKLWYVIGHLKGKYWMPVSDGFRTRGEAATRITRQKQADRAMKQELHGPYGISDVPTPMAKPVRKRSRSRPRLSR